jgi:nucleoside-diphosphate-sugar epimerase
MKVLVTGATGFLGVPLVERLLARGERDVRCFVRVGNDLGPLKKLGERYPTAQLELFPGTLTSRESAAKALQGVDVVYHAAAAKGGAAADMYLNSVVASKNLLDAMIAEKRPIKIVLVSSFGVYGVAELPKGTVVNESTPLEAHPERRDLYSQSKLRQETLFWEVREKHPYPLVVLRPGVIYGPRGSALSSRIGLDLFGIFLHIGGKNVLPLSYVDNCADAIVIAGQSERAVGQVYNVLDDELLTSAEFLKLYQKEVKPLRSVRVPYPAMVALSKAVERYYSYSKGQLPMVFSPYKTATTWKGNGFDNTKVKALGWKQLVPTKEAVARTFEYLRAKGK